MISSASTRYGWIAPKAAVRRSAINSSPPAEILWIRRSVDAIGRNADGRRVIEYCDFHDTEPAKLAP